MSNDTNIGFTSTKHLKQARTTIKTFISNYSSFEEEKQDAKETQATQATWVSPLPGHFWSLPLGKHQVGGFGSKQKYSFHTGVDLYCEHLQPLAAVEDGIVVSIQNFSKNNTKKDNDNKKPWHNNTRVILIEGKTGVVAYCNVQEKIGLKAGTKVTAGEYIGNVVRVNRKKQSKDICMLHLELYDHGTRRRVNWSFMFPKPPQLLDPSEHLISIITDSKSTIVYKRRTVTNL